MKEKVCDALNGNAWVHKITLDEDFSMDHLLQFVELWSLLLHVHLDDQVEDSISWNLTANGQYSAKSAYEVQFLGSTLSIMHKTVWKVWATPKAKFFAWLFLQNLIWTADRLQKRGWSNCGVCPLCKQSLESVHHLFVECRFTTRLWISLRTWLGINGIQPSQWVGLSVKQWWSSMTNRKAVASLTLLVTWEIWNEWNACVFRNKHTPFFVLLDKIKREVRLWVLAGAKRLGEIMPEE
jgi:hypothetical protein